MANREPLSPEELRSIEEAVGRAEATSGAEIVVYLAEASDEYHLAAWKGAVLGALAFAVAAATTFAVVDRWDLWVEAWILLPAALGASLGYLAGRLVRPLRRALIDRELLEERVERRAAEVFLAEEVFNARNRRGLLLFVSWFERRVALVADSGARGVLPHEARERVARELSRQIAQGRPLEGLLAAIAESGDLLSQSGEATPPAPSQRLPDAPRLEKDR